MDKLIKRQNNGLTVPVAEQEASLFKAITLYSTGIVASEDPDLDETVKEYMDAEGNPILSYYVYPEGQYVCTNWKSLNDIVVPDEIDGLPVVRYNDGGYSIKYDHISLGHIRELLYADMTGSTLETFNSKLSLKGVKRINLYQDQYKTQIIPEGIEYVSRTKRRESGYKNYMSAMTFPTSLKEISANTFMDFEFLEKVTFLESEQELIIRNGAFSNTGITQLDLSDNVIYVGNSAFSIKKSWDTLSLSKNLIYIGDSAFFDRNYKEKDRIAVVPDGCVYVGKQPFSEWKVVIPSSVQILGKQAHIITTAGSPAEAIAIEKGYSYEIISEEEMAQYQSQYND